MAAGLASKGGLQGEMVETLAGIYVPHWRKGHGAERFAREKSVAASRQVERALSAGPASLRLPGGPAEGCFCGKTPVFLWKTGVSLGKSHCSAVLINRCHSSRSTNGSCCSVDEGDCSRPTSGIGAAAAQLPTPPPSQPPPSLITTEAELHWADSSTNIPIQSPSCGHLIAEPQPSNCSNHCRQAMPNPANCFCSCQTGFKLAVKRLEKSRSLPILG